MSYLDRNLLPEEQILFRTKKHLIIFFYPIVLALFSFYAYNYMHTNTILINLAWLPAVVALVFFASCLLTYVTSEFAVTNKRLVMREGFFFTHATEVRINTISQVNIDQSLLGRMLEYGTVSINAFGAADAYAMIAHPVTFQKYVNEQLDRITK